MQDSLALQAHAFLIANKLTLSTAESCSGGALAARLTSIPGASKYYLGGVVPYSNESKTLLLGVPAELIIEHGAVSEEVARAMAEGVLRVLKTDYALSTTGVAGPDGGSTEKPVGTVWVAIAKKNQPTIAWKLQLQGDRLEIIRSACDALLAAVVTTNL